MSKPYSQACENNKQVILEVIRDYFAAGETILEIGSGTTQHIRFFAERLPLCRWQPTDIPENLPVMTAGLAGEDLANIADPLALDVSDEPWPVAACHGIFSANTLHIMSEDHVADFFRGAGRILQHAGYLCVYGPFKYNGQFTTASNARFDDWLKQQDPVSGVRDFETVITLAQAAGLDLVRDHTMPANNQLLVWRKGKMLKYFPV